MTRPTRAESWGGAETPAMATPTTPGPFASQVSRALRPTRATSGSPQRSTLPPSWAPRLQSPGLETLESAVHTLAALRGSPAPLGELQAGAATRTTSIDGRILTADGSGGRGGTAHVGATAAAPERSVLRSLTPERARRPLLAAPLGGLPPQQMSAMAALSSVTAAASSQPGVDASSALSLEVRAASLAPEHDHPQSGSYAQATGEDSGAEKLEPGMEVSVGDNRLRCLDILGSGSYSVVWRTEVLSSDGDGAAGTGGTACTSGTDGQPGSRTWTASSPPRSRLLLEREVALKDVLCRSKAVLQQSLFEVQLLLALERRVLLDNGPQLLYPLRLPRCFAYKVDSVEDGWRVRTAMTRLPGEQLDDWLRRAATAMKYSTDGINYTWTSQLRRGVSMAECLVRQLGPTLERLAPLAWHRDVNSHNVLVSDGVDGQLLACAPEDASNRTAFWLIDLGLAVDAKSWVSSETSQGAWRVTDIAGDCRYWPASSWMVHLYGADYLSAREEFCRQYQWRLDIHGLGITAVELLCSTALAARQSGAPADEGCDDSGPWPWLLNAWERYYESAGNWWAQIYAVFSCGGDFRPVHSWLVEERVADQVVELMEDLRQGLRACIRCVDEASGRVLHVIAELIDEDSTAELDDLVAMLDAGSPHAAGAESQARLENGGADAAGGAGDDARSGAGAPDDGAAAPEETSKPAAAKGGAAWASPHQVHPPPEDSSPHSLDAFPPEAPMPELRQAPGHVAAWAGGSGGTLTPSLWEGRAAGRSPTPPCGAGEGPTAAGEGGVPERVPSPLRGSPATAAATQLVRQPPQAMNESGADICALVYNDNVASEVLQNAAMTTSAYASRLSAAADCRRAVESLPPIPPIAAAGSRDRRWASEAENCRQNSRRSRQAELAELVEAQAQLRKDLERLQLAKLRLQQKRRLHEDRNRTASKEAAQRDDGQPAATAQGGAQRPRGSSPIRSGRVR